LHTVDLPTQLQNFRAHQQVAGGMADGAGEGVRNGVANGGEAIVSMADMEKQAILGTIRQLKGDKLMAAKLLGIGKTTLYRKLKEYGLAEAIDSLGD
jgi:transcriptional regulator of acetoin/glycerol metabolism